MKFYLVELLIFITAVIVLVNAVPTPIAKSNSTSNSNSTARHKSTQKPNSTKKPNSTTPISNSGNSTSSCFQKDNADQALALQSKFASFTTSTPCKVGDQACINGEFAQCVSENNWALQPCSSGTQCEVLPLVNKPGTSIACDSKSDADARIQAAKNA
ncbi:23896_t:CDS:2, partial [Gigaspora rosea]